MSDQTDPADATWPAATMSNVTHVSFGDELIPVRRGEGEEGDLTFQWAADGSFTWRVQPPEAGGEVDQ